MSLIELTTENLEGYRDYLSPEAAEDLERSCCGGVVVSDDASGDALAAVTWELRHINDEVSSSSELTFFRMQDGDAGRMALEAYGAEIAGQAARSWFELPGLDGDRMRAFADAGFSLSQGESQDIAVTLGELAMVKPFQGKVPSYIQGVDTLSAREYWQGIANAMFGERRGLLEDLDVLPMVFFEMEVSCFVRTDDKVRGMLLVRRLASGALMPVLFFAVEPDSRKNLLLMQRYAIREAAARYPADTPVLIRRHDAKVRALTDYLFPERRGAEVTVGEREEANGGVS